MIKYVGVVFLIICTTLLGQLISHSLYRRRNFLQRFITFLSTVETHIRYNSYEIKKVISMCISSSGIHELYKNIDCEDASPFRDIWKLGVTKIPRQAGLKNTDVELLNNFGDSLGTTDVEGQISHIELYKKLFENALNNAKDEVTTKAKLYKMLGFFAGTATALMIL